MLILMFILKAGKAKCPKFGYVFTAIFPAFSDTLSTERIQISLFQINSTSRMAACWKISVVYSTILAAESFSFAFIVYMNRYHLFIWSVFAPKFLFLVTSNALFVVIVVVYLSLEFLIEVDEK